MQITGSGFSLNEKYEDSINKILNGVRGIASIKEEIPSEILRKILIHPDVSVFVDSKEVLGGVELPRIVGPFKVHNSDFCHLFTVNLHTNVFGVTFPEYDYFLKLPKWNILYVSYVDIDSKFKNIQIIKKD
jgi:hypothetical protein